MRFLEIFLEAGEVIDKPPVVNKPPAQQPKEIPLNSPGGATVMILNDDITPAEVVVEAIMYGTGLPAGEAIRRMESAHQGGWAAIASYANRDLAESVAQKIESHAQNNDRYDHYRRHIPPRGHFGPWPLSVEVMDAEQ
jgi:ATP-dependent Clp protease adapter protein ClpS